MFLSGGLGNQMFQYAFYLARKMNQNSKVKCDIGLFKRNFAHNGYELEKIFGIKSDTSFIDLLLLRLMYRSSFISSVFNMCGYSLIMDGKGTVDIPKTKIKKNVYWVGYWQTQKYFSHIESKIRTAFRFNEKLLSLETKGWLKKIVECNSVSIHIRRGDYVSPQNVGIFGNICTLEYYKKSISLVTRSVENPYFFVFSNDIEWVKQNLDIPNVRYVNDNHGETSWQDMFLMSKCKHNIIANSSFSWWGAWLNNNVGKTVICPSKFTNRGDSPDIYLAEWTKI